MTETPSAETPKRGLERRLGLQAVLAISLGAMLGSGLFVLPGLAAANAGGLMWLAYLTAGLCVIPATLSKSELSTAMPVSGGAFVYVDRAFGPLASTIAGLGLWLSLLLKSAFALVGFGAYLRVMTDTPIEPLALGLLVGIAALNIMGVKKVGKAQSYVMALSVGTLIALTAGGLMQGEWRPSPPMTGLHGFFSTVGLVYISYAGVTKVAAIAEEVKDPDRNLPGGMIYSLLIAIALYTAITYVMGHTMPADVLEGSYRPVHGLAESLFGGTIGVIVAVVAILSMVSMANAGVLASSRFPFAMARDGLLPNFLRHLHERFLTPVPAILLTAALMAVAILYLDVQSLAKLASAMMIATFGLQNLAVIVLRESATQWYKPTWRSPLYPYIQIVGVVLAIALLSMIGWKGIGAIAGIMVIGTLIFLGIGRNAKRQGALGRLGPRRELLSDKPSEVENKLPSRAQVVVPIFGTEPSPETLALMGSALSSGGIVEVVRLQEIPEQAYSDAFDVNEPSIQSLRRRIDGLATERALALEFDAFAVYDAKRVVHEISGRVSCEWVLMEWSGRAAGRWFLFNPLGWLVGHLGCNLALFKDAGIRTFRRILVVVEPGPHDALIAGTADHLARVLKAELVLARFVADDAPPIEVQGTADYLEQMKSLCSFAPEALVVRGRDQAQAFIEEAASFDLMLLGAPPEAGLRDFFREHWASRTTRLAACSVLRLKTPQVETHKAVQARPPVAGPLSMLDFITPDCAHAQLAIADKDALFAHVAQVLAEALGNLEAATLETALWTRERTQNTSIGLGLALPHATVPSLDRTHLAIFTTAAPLDYRAPDGALVDTFFVTLGPPSQRGVHLQILAGLSRLVLGAGLAEELRHAQDGAGLLAALRAAEAKAGS